MTRMPRSLRASLGGGMTRHRAITAAVQQLDFQPKSLMDQGFNSSEDKWQDEAWDMLNSVGELQSVVRWMGSSAARVTLVAVEVDASTGQADTPTDNVDAIRIVQEMAGGVTGQSDMLRQAATLLMVVGEFYVVILQNEETGGETWALVPPDRATRDQHGAWTVKVDGKDRTLDKQTESIFRVWNRDPHYPEYATSSVRAALPILREIRAMDRTIQAASRSRISGNGIMVIPSEANIPAATAPTAGAVPGLPDPVHVQGQHSAANLSKALSEVMKRAIDDQESVASVAPIVISAPGEYVDKIKHLTLSNDLTEAALETREKSIRRLALALDIPPEILTGLGDSTHWNANLVDESALRQHIAPMMSTICEALTTAVLHPMLDGDDGTGVGTAVDDIIVGFDMSALSQKQDNSQNAIAAYERNAISIEVLRRELGFGEDDAPGEQNEEERLRSLAERMVAQAPSLFPQLRKYLGFGEDPSGGEVAGTVPTTRYLREVATNADQ